MIARIAALASGGGTNLQALLDHFHLPPPAERVAEVALVVSDRPGAGALVRAERARVRGRVVQVAERPEAESTAELLGALADAGADVVVLAGYLRRVPPEVVQRYRNRMLNVHPALLPAFGGKGMYGMRVHRAVLEAGMTVSGVTVHLVDEQYDTGPILMQWPVPVLPGDSPESLAARVLKVEHVVYPHAVEAVARSVGAATAEPVRAAAVSGTTPSPPSARSPDPAGRGTDPVHVDVAFRLAAAASPTAAEVRRTLGLDRG